MMPLRLRNPERCGIGGLRIVTNIHKNDIMVFCGSLLGYQ